MKKSIKTTIGGALAAVGSSLSAGAVYYNSEIWAPIVGISGMVINGLGVFFLGLSSRDNNVSSEDAGINSVVGGRPLDNRR